MTDNIWMRGCVHQAQCDMCKNHDTCAVVEGRYGKFSACANCTTTQSDACFERALKVLRGDGAMKILFLDIDGVLNSWRFIQRINYQPHDHRDILIDPDAIPHLQRIVDMTGCSIVISSSKRIFNSLDDIRGAMIKAGMRHCPIIDSTPRPKKLGQFLNGSFRGNEIREWVNKNKPHCYVCIDDGNDFHSRQPLVQTNPDIGLTHLDAQRCIDILLRGP